ncbi:magnesium transporter CorA family protein [Candidatus Nomurabacteria bacterium]|nr:magnesium transporter CorA family protein [Candidatus Nomurabacteria bacterium]
MIQFLRSTKYQQQIEPSDALSSGSWVRCERPDESEVASLAEIGLDIDIVQDALDPHEVPRVEQDDGWTYFITRLPDTDDDFNDFTTPILFAIHHKYVATVSRDNLSRLWQPFMDTVHISTGDQTQLFAHMIDAITTQYQRRVATINRQMRAAISDVQNLGSKDIAVLTDYERKLNDYLDALVPTTAALQKILSGKVIPLQETDRDLVEDVTIDIEQVSARCKSLLRTITNVRDSYRAVMDTRLNETIRLLTVITVSLTIPTMIAGLFGMNVPIPFANSPLAFWEILGVSAIIAALIGFYFLRKR